MTVEPFEFDSPIRQFLTGREKEIGILQHELVGSMPKTVCITGLPGVGKTSLALMFAERNRAAFPAGKKRYQKRYRTPFRG